MFRSMPNLSRRAFLRKAGQLLAVIVGSRLPLMISAAARQPSSQVVAYGQGTYGAGLYPGYQTYLPLVGKEGN